jgi:hypothetical protein
VSTKAKRRADRFELGAPSLFLVEGVAAEGWQPNRPRVGFQISNGLKLPFYAPTRTRTEDAAKRQLTSGGKDGDMTVNPPSQTAGLTSLATAFANRPPTSSQTAATSTSGRDRVLISEAAKDLAAKLEGTSSREEQQESAIVKAHEQASGSSD